MPHNILILGASYGSLLGTKLLMAGHAVCLVCTKATAQLIEREGTRVRFPLPAPAGQVEIASQALPGKLTACTPDQPDVSGFDLVVLAMQEPQLAAPSVKGLMGRVAAARKPCLAIMNMPPLPYLERVLGIISAPLSRCYLEPRVWDAFDPELMTLASPDAQAFRPAGEPKNVLQVGLATNFKAARFGDEEPTETLRRLAADVEAVRVDVGGSPTEVPVKLKVHDSVFVPLAKWPMLVTGNYRCIRKNGMVSIRDAVHGDIEESRRVYQWACELCVALGADPADLVAFEKYARAAASLQKPSSAARALDAGVEHIERVDHLVQQIAVQQGLACHVLDAVVEAVDARVGANRAAAGARQRALAA